MIEIEIGQFLNAEWCSRIHYQLSPIQSYEFYAGLIMGYYYRGHAPRPSPRIALTWMDFWIAIQKWWYRSSSLITLSMLLPIRAASSMQQSAICNFSPAKHLMKWKNNNRSWSGYTCLASATSDSDNCVWLRPRRAMVHQMNTFR